MRKFILDTDWWTDCDDAVALRLLCNAHKNREIELIGININACMPYSVPSVDVFTRDSGLDIPIGIDHSATDFDGKPPYQKHLAEVGKPERQNDDVPDGVEFYRSLLSKSEDGSVEILSIGFTQVLAGLLKSAGGVELVRSKVRHLWIMAGKWDEEEGREYNFYKNEMTCRSGAEVCDNWPTGVTFLGYEVGESVKSGGKLPDGDLLKQVMMDHGSVNGRSSWDPMLALLAVTGEPEAAGYRCVYGSAKVDPENGRNRFVPSPNGRHRYVIKLHSDDYYVSAIDARL